MLEILLMPQVSLRRSPLKRPLMFVYLNNLATEFLATESFKKGIFDEGHSSILPKALASLFATVTAN